MHSNWTHCLQEYFSSRTLVQKSYHQDLRTLLTKMKAPLVTFQANIGAGMITFFQKFDE